MDSKRYDAILSTLNPMTAHQIACFLKKQTRLLWVADYRDLWADRHYEKLPKWYYHVSFWYEKRLLNSTYCLTIVSEPWVERLHELHQLPSEYISNGFDPEFVNPGISLDRKLTINYTGSLYGPDKYDPRPLFQALSELKMEGQVDTDNMCINFYGATPQWLVNEIRTIQYSSQILLLLTWGEEIGDGQYTGKVYEYLTAKRPILAIWARKENVVVNGFLNRTNSGFFLLLTHMR